jgi:KaiC/GvpD/RAD55 family RecA-like ATPase
MVSTGLKELDQLLGTGYPERSSILVVGPPGIGKEALAYRFAQSGMLQGDLCLYVTRLSVAEVVQDVRAYNVDPWLQPKWLARQGGQEKLDVNDLTSISFNVKELIRKAEDRRVRVIADVLSSLLMLNPPETVYRFLSQLLAEVKQYNAVFLATVEQGMHRPDVLAAMEQIFDGVLELKLYEEGFRIVPLLRIRKMRGVPPQLGYFRFTLSHGRTEVTPYAK